MKSVFVSIGNTDNRLTQLEWSNFVRDVEYEIHMQAKVHFFGGAPNWEPWQNVGWLIDIDESKIRSLKETLIVIRIGYRQNSVAWLEGETKFL